MNINKTNKSLLHKSRDLNNIGNHYIASIRALLKRERSFYLRFPGFKQYCFLLHLIIYIFGAAYACGIRRALSARLFHTPRDRMRLKTKKSRKLNSSGLFPDENQEGNNIKSAYDHAIM
ncbi:MAG: hypothetical protein IJ268_10480, partial [Proteobacteria bacterium]|nr:hypothetical protein [Pseudomonadota bacterium]